MSFHDFVPLQADQSILSRPKRSEGRIEACPEPVEGGAAYLEKPLSFSPTRTLRYAASLRSAATQDAFHNFQRE
jgi:hypothetical protein